MRLRMMVGLAGAFLAAGFIGCGGGGGTDAVREGVITSLSTESWNHSEAVTDGEWVAWAGRDPMRVMINDGSRTRELAGGKLKGKIIREAFYDGRYVVMKASDPFVPYGTEVYYYDAQNGGAVVNASAFADDRTDSPDISAVKVASGLVVWEADGAIYVHEIASKSTTVVSMGGSVDQDSPPSTSGKVVAWIEDGDLCFRDYNEADPVSAVAAAGTFADPKVAGRKIIASGYDVDNWEVFSYDIDADTLTNLSDDGATDDTTPAVSGDIAVWRNGDGSVYARDFVTPGASFLVDDSGYANGDLQAKDGWCGWLSSDDNQIWVADLSAGALTVASTAAQASTGFYPQVDNEFNTNHWALGNGEVVWTDDDPNSDNSDSTRLIWRHDISAGTTTLVPDFGPGRRVASLRQVSGGVTMWISVGAFDRIFVQQVGSSLDPVAISQDGDYSHQPQVDGGLLAWAEKPGLEDTPRGWEIFYCDLNAGLDPVQLTDNGWRDKKPMVDGANRIIAWRGGDMTGNNNDNYMDMFIEKLGDGVGPRRLTNDTVRDEDHTLVDGLLTWEKNNNQLWYYQFTAAAGTAGVKQLLTGYNTTGCPDNDGRYTTWLQYNTSTGKYRIFYADLLAASPVAVPFTSLDSVDTSYNYPSISGGVIAFHDHNATATTDRIYAYQVGDPMDSLLKLTEVATTDEYWAVHRIRISGDTLAWTQFVPEVGSLPNNGQNFEIFTCDLGAASPAPVRITDNTYHDGNPFIHGKVLLWMAGGFDDNEGGNQVVQGTLLP